MGVTLFSEMVKNHYTHDRMYVTYTSYIFIFEFYVHKKKLLRNLALQADTTQLYFMQAIN